MNKNLIIGGSVVLGLIVLLYTSKKVFNNQFISKNISVTNSNGDIIYSVIKYKIFFGKLFFRYNYGSKLKGDTTTFEQIILTPNTESKIKIQDTDFTVKFGDSTGALFLENNTVNQILTLI